MSFSKDAKDRRPSNCKDAVRDRRSSCKSTTYSIIRRTSNKLKQPIRVYQPTYQLDPRTPFNSETVQKILRRVVDAELEELEYCEKNVPQACLILAELLRSAIKEQNYDRYRIIVAVTIGQKRAQSVNICHSFLWDPDRDAYVTHNFENVHIYANVVVYGIYLD